MKRQSIPRTAILKPNELAPATSRIPAEIIRQVLDERSVFLQP